MIKPTREEVEKWKYESAHSPLHDHAYENHNRLICLADAYLAQGEELEAYQKCYLDFEAVVPELQADNRRLKAENQALKAELLRLEA